LRVLLIEDNQTIGTNVRRALRDEGYNVDWVTTIEEAEAALKVATFSLLLLDLGLPDGDGLTFLKAIRRDGQDLLVMVLTARAGLNDRLDGLDGGADDYLIKPFAISELCSRCRALLRRKAILAPKDWQLGNLSVEHAGGLISIEGKSVELARRELQLLKALFKRSETIATRLFLDNELYDFNSQASQNALEASVYRLRATLQLHGANVEIRTIRGIGYKLHVRLEQSV
jgi:two-component system OmpR family response regulator